MAVFVARSAVLEARSQRQGHTCKHHHPAHLMHGWCVFQGAEFWGSLPAPLFKLQPCTGLTQVKLPEPSATEFSAPLVNGETSIVSSLIEDAPFTTLIPSARLSPSVHFPRPIGLGPCSLSLLLQPELGIPGLHIAPHSRPCVSEASLGFLVFHPLPLRKNNATGQENTGLGLEPTSLRGPQALGSACFCTSRCPPRF